MKRLFAQSEKGQGLAEYAIIFSVFLMGALGVFSVFGPTLKSVVVDMTDQMGITIVDDGGSTVLLSKDSNSTCDGAMDDDCFDTETGNKDNDGGKDEKCTGQTKDDNGHDHNNDGHTDCGDNGNGHDKDHDKDKNKNEGDDCTGQTKDKDGHDHNNDGHTDCGDNGHGHDKEDDGHSQIITGHIAALLIPTEQIPSVL